MNFYSTINCTFCGTQYECKTLVQVIVIKQKTNTRICEDCIRECNNVVAQVRAEKSAIPNLKIATTNGKKNG